MLINSMWTSRYEDKEWTHNFAPESIPAPCDARFFALRDRTSSEFPPEQSKAVALGGLAVVDSGPESRHERQLDWFRCRQRECEGKRDTYIKEVDAILKSHGAKDDRATRA